jgi:GDPmannose 4,6-dehydratase
MQLDKSVDVVIGTGVSYTVRNFLDYAFDYCGVKIIWTGSGTNEKAIVDDFDSRWAKVLKKGQAVVKIDPRYYRPTEVEHLKADISYMKEILGREPKIKFHELIKIMMDSDMLKNGLTPLGEGFAIHNDLNFKWSSNLQISGLN